MTGFLLRRLVWLIIVLWTVFTISFVLMKNTKGSPFDSERRVDPVIEENLKRKYGLDQPVHVQYLRMLGQYMTLDLGYCMKLDRPVSDVIAQGLPVSMALGLLALSFAFVLGLAAGIASAVARGSGVDVSLMTLAAVGISLPNFVVAGVSILLFVFWMPLLPAAGWGSFRQLVLPALCLGAPYAAYVARIARTGMLDVLGQDHIRTARAKGLRPRDVVLRHALPTAMLPVVSFLGPAVAGVLTGSPVVEQIFAIPGIGWHFVQSAQQQDQTLAMGTVMLYTLLLYTMNLLVDLAYGLLDPRVELE